MLTLIHIDVVLVIHVEKLIRLTSDICRSILKSLSFVLICVTYYFFTANNKLDIECTLCTKLFASPLFARIGRVGVYIHCKFCLNENAITNLTIKILHNIYFDSDLFLYTRDLKTEFWIQNYLLNLCSITVNSQRSLCSQKAGLKCPY